MNDLEDKVRQALADPGWALPVPADPAAWAKQRARRRRWPLLAAVAAAATAVAASVAVPAVLQPARERAALVAEQSRDGLTLRVELDADRAVVGRRLTGEVTVRNDRAEAVRLLEGCRAPLRLFADYRSVFAGPSPGGQAGEYRSLVLGASAAREPGRPLVLVVGRYPVVREERDCADRVFDGTVELATGGATTVRVDWSPGSHNGAQVDTVLPMLANVTYLLPDGPEGQVEGDPETRGSATPQARVLAAEFSLPLSGGDPGRASLPDLVDAALADPDFRATVEGVQTSRWTYAWALPFDKPSRDTGGSFTAAQSDTDQMLQPSDSWHVVLRHTTDAGGGARTTAVVDGRTAEVRDVATRPEDRP